MWESFVDSVEWRLIAQHIRATCLVQSSIKIALLERQPKYRLIRFVWAPPENVVQLVEVYRHFLSNRDYFRIYLSPSMKYVPCLIMGHESDLIQLAKRNGQQPLPVFNELHEKENSLFQNTVEYLEEIYPEFNTLLGDYLFFIRPCTFVLNKVETVSIDQQIIKIKYYFDRVHNSDDFFIHITLKDERDYWSTINGFGVVLTNSDAYYLRQSNLLQFYYMPGDIWASIG